MTTGSSRQVGNLYSVDSVIAAHEADTTAHPAANIVNTPAGNIAATDVQAAINELDAKKAAKIDPLSIGNITDPLVHIPLRRADDELRLSDVQTYARSSTGSYIDQLDGLLKTAAIDAPRFERMSDGGIGLLLEDASTNLLTYSEQLDNAAWTKTDVTVTADAIAAPDGNTTADLVVASNISAQHRITQIPASLNAATYTVSVCVKDGGYSSIGNFTILMWNASESAQADFDVANGVTVGTGSGTIYDSHSIEDMGNGWYRCSMTFTPTATETLQFMNYIGTGTTTGDGIKGYYLWGAQLENLPFATSYIPTTSSTVTRAGDSLSVPASGNILSADSDISFIMDVELKQPYHNGNFSRIFDVSGYTYWRLYMASTTDGALSGGLAAGSYISGVTLTQGNVTRVVVKKTGSTVSFWADGVKANEFTSVTDATGSATKLNIGSSDGTGARINMYIRNFRIYDRALPDAEIAVA